MVYLCFHIPYVVQYCKDIVVWYTYQVTFSLHAPFPKAIKFKKIRQISELYAKLNSLLTKFGYITKIKKITGSCTQTAVISCLILQN